MFRKPRFRPVRRDMIGGVPPILRRAHELMLREQFDEAAGIYEQLAYGAQSRGLPQDAHLFMTAGHCRVRNRQIDLAMGNFKQGLEIMAARGRLANVSQVGQRCEFDLKNAGFEKEAYEINQLIQSLVGQPTYEVQPATSIRSRIIPVTCDACGGTLRADEVEWIDDSTAECPWCGSTIQST